MERTTAELAAALGTMQLHEAENPHLLLESSDWTVDVKQDGVRALVKCIDGKVEAWTRSGLRLNVKKHQAAFAVIQAHFGRPGDVWVLDCEALADGRLVLFDLLVAGESISPSSPWSERRSALEHVARLCGFSEDAGLVRICRHASTRAAKVLLFDQVLEAGLEGVVFKHRRGTYRSGKRTWEVLKWKLSATADVRILSLGERNMRLSMFRDGVEQDVGGCGRRQCFEPYTVGEILEVKYFAVDDHLMQTRIIGHRPDRLEPGEFELCRKVNRG